MCRPLNFVRLKPLHEFAALTLYACAKKCMQIQYEIYSFGHGETLDYCKIYVVTYRVR